jgi:prepilin-type N-terminal cleavage/methylation domain-containing protein
MNRNAHHHPPRGFTLIEMLVTITVIGIIVAMAYGALSGAQDSARKAKTKALITKLHTQLMYRWESYQTRRLPMMNVNGKAQDRAWHRLHAMAN